MSESRFQGQVALVTGGGSGIGLGIAGRLAREGGTVILVDNDGDALQYAAESIGASAEMARADVRDEARIREVMRRAAQRHGKLDIVVNSAGIVGPSAMDIVDFDTEAFRQTLDINLTGSFIVCKCALEAMLPRAYGRVLLIASISGKEGNPGMSAYSASKAGVIGLVKAVGKEVARGGITVNGLAPALIDTPLTQAIEPEQRQKLASRIPMGRLGTIDEVAALACWIVSREASFTTGAIYDLSGGRATY